MEDSLLRQMLGQSVSVWDQGWASVGAEVICSRVTEWWSVVRHEGTQVHTMSSDMDGCDANDLASRRLAAADRYAQWLR